MSRHLHRTTLRERALWLGRHAVRFIVVVAVMSWVSSFLDKAHEPRTFAYLQEQQSLALATVAGFRPAPFFDRFVCAMGPSVPAQNRRISESVQGTRFAFLGRRPLSEDCMYKLSPAPPVQGAALPPPVVGHWAEGMNGLVMPFAALLDTGWHLVVQPSLFASILAIAVFLAAGAATGMLMMLPTFTWHPYVGASVFALGTIAISCLVAFVFQGVMDAGLVALGRLTSFGAFCCTASGLMLAAYNYAVKGVEVATHMGLDHILPK